MINIEFTSDELYQICRDSSVVLKKVISSLEKATRVPLEKPLVEYIREVILKEFEGNIRLDNKISIIKRVREIASNYSEENDPSRLKSLSGAKEFVESLMQPANQN